MSKFHVHTLSRKTYMRTVVWAFFLCFSIVICTALLGRATHNFKAALTEKPDVAIYLLLPEEGLKQTTLLRETDTTRDYLAETKDGEKLIKLEKNREGVWEVATIERLHADPVTNVSANQ
jgi:hypothetical protein